MIIKTFNSAMLEVVDANRSRFDTLSLAHSCFVVRENLKNHPRTKSATIEADLASALETLKVKAGPAFSAETCFETTDDALRIIDSPDFSTKDRLAEAIDRVIAPVIGFGDGDWSAGEALAEDLVYEMARIWPDKIEGFFESAFISEINRRTSSASTQRERAVGMLDQLKPIVDKYLTNWSETLHESITADVYLFAPSALSDDHCSEQLMLLELVWPERQLVKGVYKVPSAVAIKALSGELPAPWRTGLNSGFTEIESTDTIEMLEAASVFWHESGQDALGNPAAAMAAARAI